MNEIISGTNRRNERDKDSTQKKRGMAPRAPWLRSLPLAALYRLWLS
jgi:hypothetical protein